MRLTTPNTKTRTLRGLLLLLLLALPGALTGAARAATLTVTDPGDSGGSGQLRQVLGRANAGDAVVFAAGVTAITLNGNELQITRPLTVSGPGVTINANGKSRVLEVIGGTASQPVALGGLTITGGSAAGGSGGGVLVDGGGNVTLTDCTLTGDSATEFGGGLLNDGGTATLTDCALTGDTATGNGGFGGDGGGLCNNGGGTTTLTGCALAGDSVTGGGPYNDGANGGQGGGLYNGVGTATLTNCALTGDRADIGGGLYNGGPLSLTGCTLTGNSAGYEGGGLFNDSGSTAMLVNDILYGDSANTGPEVFTKYGKFFDYYCDIGPGNGYNGGPGNINQDPLFVSSTDPHLRPGSPCAGAGSSSYSSSYRPSDMDGRPRPTPGLSAPSLGAYEAAPSGAYSLVVESVLDGVAQSLRAAVQCANDYPNAAVTFDPAVFTTFQTIPLTGGQLTLSQPMTITAPAPGVAVSGNHSSRVFEVSSTPGAVALLGLTVVNGTASNSVGGGVLVDGGATATLTACTLTGDSAPDGGGLYNSGTATLTACALTGDSAAYYGGGLYNHGGALTVTGCTLTGNSAGYEGGGLFDDSAPATLTDDILYGDSANTGPEVYQYGAAVTASYSDIGQTGGYTDGGHDINRDPAFVGAPTDLHVRPGSPVVGAGVAAAGDGTDITGATRANPPTLGAYEGTGIATRTTLTSSLDPSDFGQSVTFTVTVANAASAAGPVPAGTVTLFGLPGGAQTLTLTNGQAAYATSALPSGSYSLNASYAPAAGNFTASVTALSLTQTVLVNDQTTLASSLNPSLAGQGVTFTATVDTQGGPAPAGSVSFYVDGAAAPAATVTVSGTTASYATSGLSPGPHAVTATFTGAGFVTSSAALTQTVATSISGTVTLTGWLGTGEPTPQLTFTLTPAGQTSGGTTQTLTPVPTSAAPCSTFTFTLPGVAPGSYTLGVKGALWLREDATVNVSTAGASGANVTLPPGDVSGDNVIDGNDTALLRLYFNTVSGRAGFSAGADLNGDGVVDGNDTALLRAHFNTVGRPF